MNVDMILFCKVTDFGNLRGDGLVVFPTMRAQAVGAILEPLRSIGEITAAVFSQGVQRAIAEQTAEGFRVCVFVAGEVFTCFVLKKVIIGHRKTSFPVVK